MNFMVVRPRSSSYVRSFVPFVLVRPRPCVLSSPFVLVRPRTCILSSPFVTVSVRHRHRLRPSPSPSLVARYLTYGTFPCWFGRVRPSPDPLWPVTVSVRLRPSLLDTSHMTVSMGSFAVYVPSQTHYGPSPSPSVSVRRCSSPHICPFLW